MSDPEGFGQVIDRVRCLHFLMILRSAVLVGKSVPADADIGASPPLMDDSKSFFLMSLLTVKLVEQIQESTSMGHDVGDFIARLNEATLPALLEYGCLRWATKGKIPQLPQAVVDTELGQSLNQVRSDLGLRTVGLQKPALKRIDVQLSEFHVIEGSDGFQKDEWSHFEIRFDRSAQHAGFSDKKAHMLQAALHEMAENAVIHAKTPTAILAGYRVAEGLALFSVADVGIGVLQSLRSHQDFQHLHVHNEAIREALHDGTTRFGRSANRGLGFRQVFKALVAQWGYLRFRSGNGCITLDGQDLDADQGQVTFPPMLPGFQVTVCCRTSSEKPSTPFA